MCVHTTGPGGRRLFHFKSCTQKATTYTRNVAQAARTYLISTQLLVLSAALAFAQALGNNSTISRQLHPGRCSEQVRRVGPPTSTNVAQHVGQLPQSSAKLGPHLSLFGKLCQIWRPARRKCAEMSRKIVCGAFSESCSCIGGIRSNLKPIWDTLGKQESKSSNLLTTLVQFGGPMQLPKAGLWGSV